MQDEYYITATSETELWALSGVTQDTKLELIGVDRLGQHETWIPSQ